MKSPQSDILKKSNLMFLLILGLWFLSLVHFDPWLFRFLKLQANIAGKFSLIGFIVCINIFWLYGFYHFIVPLFSIFSKYRLPLMLENLQRNNPKVAILYTTMNDFKYEAIRSFLNQDYTNYDVYILDDSTDEKIKKEIDSIVKRHNSKLKIIRRNNRKAFKAGNLNNALEKIYSSYEYFAVCDSDTILPINFISKLIPYFSIDKSIGFVQANNRANPRQESSFAKELCHSIDCVWKYYQPALNRFGFVMFQGHGALIRTDVWREVDGFPDTVTEDMAFSSIIREKGYKGIFVEDVICYEDFPLNYTRFLRRNERWTKGTTEYFMKWFAKFLFNKKISIAEKLDMLISKSTLLLPIPFIIYLFVVAVTLPLYFEEFRLNIPLYFNFFTSPKYKINWPFDFYLMMIFFLSSQISASIYLLIKKPLKLIQYVVFYGFIGLMTFVVSTGNIISYLVTKKSYFPVTGSKDLKDIRIRPIIELIVAFTLFYFLIQTSNLWLLTLVIGLIISALLYKIRWENVYLRPLVYTPAIINLAIIITIGISYLW
jgi:cellulose synthase/poly-beta-1,6-N-acetylglucosamine synthase-like glycosyltransferase